VAQEVTAQLAVEVSRTVQNELPSEVARQTAQAMEELSQRVVPQAAEQAAGQVFPQVAAMGAELTAKLDEQGSQSSAAVTEEVTRRLQEHLSSVLAPELARQAAEQAAQQVTAIVPQEVAAQLTGAGQQWSEQVTRDVDARIEPLPQQLADEITDRVKSNLGEQIAAQVARQVAAEQAAFEAQRTAWEQEQRRTQSEINTHAQHLEKRLEALMRFQRGLDAQHLQWQNELQTLRPEVLGRTEQVERMLAELRQQTEWVAQHDPWKQELLAWREELAQRSHEVEQRLATLVARWETFEQQQLQRHSDAERSLADHSEQINHRLAEIRAQREAFEQEREQAAAEREHVHPGEYARQLDERLAELHCSRESGQRERQDNWSDESSSTRPTEERPTIDMQSAMAAGGGLSQWDMLEDQVQAVEEPPAHAAAESDVSPSDGRQPAESAAVDDSSPAAPVEPSEMFRPLPGKEEGQPAGVVQDGAGGNSEMSHDEDESIDDYMARLMDRVRSMQTGPAAVSAPTEARLPTAPVVAHRKEDQTESLAKGELPKVKSLAELAPRATAPELTTDMSAMRDLANLSARSAIDAHTRKRMRSVVWGKLMVCFVALAAAAGLTWLSGRGGQVAYGAALVSTIIAVIWGVEYLVLSGYNLWRSKTGSQQFQPKVTRQPAASDAAKG
jgi:hypothetical protein